MTDLKAHIAVVDDDADTQDFLKSLLEQEGYAHTGFNSATEALDFLRKSDTAQESGIDLILTDVRMPGMDGFEFIETLKSEGMEVPVICITAYGSLETAVQAMRRGAYDYIVKPFKKDELLVAIEGALKFQKLTRENRILRNEVRQSWSFDNIIGKSHAIRAVFDLVKRVAPTSANILITGESGTGKELVARAIHNHSPKKDHAFVAINCSAIPENLLESELFGHAKGSFTGAHQNKKGLFEEANHGTIFLDEIGDMDMPLQAKLLRVLQERKIRPVGANNFIDLDVRIIAATHKDVRVAIKENRFREDLYYRLAVIPMELPPLRQRKEDIPVLAEYFLKKHCSTHKLNIRGFTKAAHARLLSHPWEGNVRELENALERATLLCQGDVIDEVDLPHADDNGSGDLFLEEKAMEFMSLKEIEKRYISLILRRTGGKKERASHILGIDRKTLYRKEKEYGLGMETGEVDASDTADECPKASNIESHSEDASAPVTHPA